MWWALPPRCSPPLTSATKQTTLQLSVSGVTPEYAEVRNRPVEIGNFISEADVNGRTRVAVIGSAVAERFFDEVGVYPIGATLQINDIPFKVIGVLEERGGTGGPGRQPG